MLSSSNSGKSPQEMPNSSDVTSAVPFSTPSSHDHDAGNSFPSSSLQNRAQPRSSQRLRHARLSVGSYNENVLSGSARKRRRIDMASEDHTVAVNTFVPVDGAEIQLLAEAGQLPRSALRIGAVSEQTVKTLEDKKQDTDRRKSTRLEMLQRATELVETAKNCLGKRGRDNCLTEPQEVDKRPTRRNGGGTSVDIEALKPEGPIQKRARLLNESNGSDKLSKLGIESKIFRKAVAKRWLSHGLYIGQDENTCLRVSQQRSKLKRPLDACAKVEGRKFLPMPMFGGHRMIEMGRDFKLPFDVFSPLPPGQPRPEEWKKVHRNVLVGEAINLWKKAKPLESSQCVCTPQSGCDEECFNRFMFYECDSSNCNVGADCCTNRSFENLRQRTKAGGKFNVGVEVIKTLDRGHGVRSNRCFEPNQIIVEYTGEIITQIECDNRMKNHYKDSECCYLMDFDQQMILDGTRGSIARFINHSCEPNCKMVKWTVGGTPRMALFAGDKGIMTGEELTYDYNFNPYSVKNVQQCRCGAPSCRGVLGPKTKETRDALKPLTTAGKRKFQQAAEQKVQTIVEKHKLAIPSVKRGFAVIKNSMRKRLANAHILRSSLVPNEKSMKTVSAQPMKGSRKSENGQNSENHIKRLDIITHSRPRRPAQTRITNAMSHRPANTEANLRSKAESVKDNIVGTAARRSPRTNVGNGGEGGRKS